MGKVSVDDKYIWNFLKLEINFNVETIKAVSEKKIKIKIKIHHKLYPFFFVKFHKFFTFSICKFKNK